MNTYIGDKVAIVTPKPQTTRNQISGILSEPSAQVIFVDTPGVHQLRGKMNRMLVQSAWQAMHSADLVLVVLDAHAYVRRPETLERDLEPMLQAIAHENRPVAVAFNKVDLFHDKSRMLPLLQQLHETWPRVETFPVSALTGEGLSPLLAFIKEHLPTAPAQFPEDQLSTAPLRFMVAEIIREKLFLSLKQELPYYTAVDIEQWKEDAERRFTTIHATIYVGRSTHKGMVIGKNGQNLKQIGTDARKEIEPLLEHKVHLELWVKVREGWTEDHSFLQALHSASQE
jgi:GTP-binding protein Era